MYITLLNMKIQVRDTTLDQIDQIMFKMNLHNKKSDPTHFTAEVTAYHRTSLK